MRKHFRLLGLLALFFTAMAGCKKDDGEEIDTEYPEIVATANSFPQQCSLMMRGQTALIKLTFSDNRELGAYSLDIHNNFDHHNHSTEVNDCNLEAKKTPIKPLLFVQNYDIPTGLKRYEATAQIAIPADVDPGDYHFLIRLTDKEGWQTIKGLSIKIQ